MNRRSNLKAACSGILVTLLAFTVTAVAHAYNRNDVFSALDAIPVDWPDNRLDVRLKGVPDDPVVTIGAPLSLVAAASEASHFTMILVDAHGELSVLAANASLSEPTAAAHARVYPPPGTGQLLQGKPAGLQRVYLLATERPIPPERLGMTSGGDIATIARDATSVASLLRTLSDATLTGRRAMTRYEWLVDADVEVATRAMRRELTLRVQQVDMLDEEARTSATPQATTAGTSAGSTANERVQSDPLAISDIRFETDSAELTDVGRAQLDILASELLRQGSRRDGLDVALEGHTDDRGSDPYNDRLSLARADAAKRYLVEQFALDEASISTRGRGERTPRVANADAASRALNRRVEIRILGQ